MVSKPENVPVITMNTVSEMFDPAQELLENESEVLSMKEKLDTHGLKIIGLKRASGATKDYGPYDGRYNEIFYNRATGEVWTVFQYSLGQNSWSVYHDSNIIKIENTTRHMTMQDLADAISNVVTRRTEK